MRRPPSSPRNREELEQMLLEALKEPSIPWISKLRDEIIRKGRQSLKSKARRAKHP